MAEETTVLLKINNVDFTSRIVQRSYSVQKQDVFSTWTDGNWITHREIVRTVISGSFNMTFIGQSQYEAFLNAVNAVKTAGGWCPIQLWVNNTKALETVNAFLTISTKTVWTTDEYGKLPELAGVTVKVTQR